jgi:hypothetical protein
MHFVEICRPTRRSGGRPALRAGFARLLRSLGPLSAGVRLLRAIYEARIWSSDFSDGSWPSWLNCIQPIKHPLARDTRYQSDRWHHYVGSFSLCWLPMDARKTGMSNGLTMRCSEQRHRTLVAPHVPWAGSLSLGALGSSIPSSEDVTQLP